MPESLLNSIVNATEESSAGSFKNEKSSIVPLDDAVDFGDIDELAVEDQQRQDLKAKQSSFAPTKSNSLKHSGSSRSLRDITSSTINLTMDPKLEVKRAFPWFEKNKILCFSELYAPDESAIQSSTSSLVTSRKQLRPGRRTLLVKNNLWR